MEQKFILELTFKKLIMDSYRRSAFYSALIFSLIAVSFVFAAWMLFAGNTYGAGVGMVSMVVFAIIYYYKYSLTEFSKPKVMRDHRLATLKGFLNGEPENLEKLKWHNFFSEFFVS